MTDLSPATRAVFEAFNSKFEWIEDGVPGPQFHAIAAALRAVADQVVPERLLCTRTAEERTLYHEGRLDAAIRFRATILAIATELGN